MTLTNRFSALAGAMAATFCLVGPATTTSNEAIAQLIVAPGTVRSHHDGYNAAYEIRYGYGGNAYTGYGSGPYGYGYGSPIPYGYRPPAGYGYRSGTTRDLYYGGGGTFGEPRRAIYRPTNSRFYSPYGYRRN